MAGGFWTIESNKQTTTRTARLPATIIKRSLTLQYRQSNSGAAGLFMEKKGLPAKLPRQQLAFDAISARVEGLLGTETAKTDVDRERCLRSPALALMALQQERLRAGIHPHPPIALGRRTFYV